MLSESRWFHAVAVATAAVCGCCFLLSCGPSASCLLSQRDASAVLGGFDKCNDCFVLYLCNDPDGTGCGGKSASNCSGACAGCTASGSTAEYPGYDCLINEDESITAHPAGCGVIASGHCQWGTMCLCDNSNQTTTDCMQIDPPVIYNTDCVPE